MPRTLSFLIALLLAIATALALPAEKSLVSPRATDPNQSVLTGQSASPCSYTAQCANCEPNLGYRGGTQCCWPRGQGGGSPFTQPGYCLCAPPGFTEAALCLGGSWVS